MKKNIFVILILAFIFLPAKANSLYKNSVIASYYAEDFHGKKTSNGEIFDMWAMTCAHKMLPFNTILKVTNLSNGKSVQVRVNDRGPFVGTREIDLSKGAAFKLGMIGSGIAKVRLEIVKLAPYTKQSVQTAKKACKMAGIKYVQLKIKKTQNPSEENSNKDKIEKIKNTKREDGKFWDVQIGAFSKRESALEFAKKVQSDGFKNVILQKTSQVVRVSIKAVETKDLIEKIDALTAKGYTDIVIRERKTP